MAFSLAHVSDLHLAPGPDGIAPGRLAGKQVLALLAWRRKWPRADLAQGEAAGAAAALLADLAAHAPDHVAVTGDLVNLAAPTEFEAARTWLQGLGPAGRVSVVPGNHDATMARPWQSGLGLWEPWMRSDPGMADGGAGPFPFLRRRGPVALIGLSSAVPTPIGSAAGRLGAAQLERLPALLRQAREEGLLRVVLIHHPPVMGEGGRRKALRDRAALRAVLARCGAELVLHGHHHLTQLAGIPGPDGPITVCGAPSGAPSARAGHGRHPREPQGWRLYRIDRAGPGWRLSSHGRRYDPATGGFQQSGAWCTTVPAAGA